MRDRIVPNLLRTYRRRTASPVILEAKEGMFERVRSSLREMVPVRLLEARFHTFMPRLMRLIEFPLSKWKEIKTFNMIATVLTPNLIEEAAQWREVQKIYPDYIKWALQVVPPEGIFKDYREKPFTSTYWCYSEDTELLTSDGFKYFYELSKEDEIATLNPKTHTLEYQKPRRIVSFDYEGTLYHFKGRFIDLLVTPNHRMYVRGRNTSFKVRTAEELAKMHPESFEFKRDANWKGKNCEYITVPKYQGKRTGRPAVELKPIPLDVWLKFMGWYLSEGSVYVPQRRITITQKNKENVEKIMAILKQMGLRPVRDGKNIHVYSVQLAHYLKRFGKSHERYIPRELKQLPPNKLLVLLSTLLKGDGRHGGRTYDTVSKKLAEDVAELVLKSGYGFTISKGNPCTSVGISKVSLTPKLKKRPRTIHYQGKVWCVEVPNGIFYVGRNGKFCWSGNTKRMLGLDRANRQGFTGRGVSAVVIDTGARVVHEQLRRVKALTAMPEKGASGQDSNGHGSWCTACVGGSYAVDRRYKVAVEGMAPESSLISIQALGFIIGMGCSSDILQAMEMSARLGVKVVSMSLGSVEAPKDEYNPESKAINELVARGVIPVVAAGNSGPDPATIGTPGSCLNSLTVGSVSPFTEEISDFSSRGPTAGDGYVKPDVLAPGERINSALIGFLDQMTDPTQTRFGAISGTSMATPHVAGLVTCMAQLYREKVGKELTVEEIKTMMAQLGREKNNDSGYGLISWDMVETWVSTTYGIEL